MKFKLLLLFLFINVISFTLTGQETPEDVIAEVANEIGNDLSPVLDIVKKGEFPKDTAGWIMLIFTTLLPFITQFSTNKVKYMSLFARIKAKSEGSKTIAFIVSMVIGLAYEIITSGAQFDAAEWGAYSVLVYGGAILVHEIIASLKSKKEIKSV